MQITLAPEMKELLDLAIKHKASDLHLTVGVPPVLRVDGRLSSVPNKAILNLDAVSKLIQSFMTEEQMKVLQVKKEIDFSYGYQTTRFRTTSYYQKGNIAASSRLLLKEIKSVYEINLAPIIK